MQLGLVRRPERKGQRGKREMRRKRGVKPMILDVSRESCAGILCGSDC